MIAVHSLEAFKKELETTRTPIIGLLFAPPFSKTGVESVLDRLTYLDERSGEHIHFFCAGFGAYNFAPDAKPTGHKFHYYGNEVEWQFSQREFARFVTSLEDSIEWNYSGDAELLLTDGWHPFEESIVYDLNRMIKDGAIDHPWTLFEAIIRYAKKCGSEASAYKLSDRHGLRLLGKTGANAIVELLPTPLQKIWKEGLHYRIRNLSKPGQITTLQL